MEVVHRRVEEEGVVVKVEEQLLSHRRWADLADPRNGDGGETSESSDETMNGGYEVHQNVISDEKSVFFDDKKDHTKIQWSEIDNHEEISKIVNDVVNNQNLENFKGEILTVPSRENVIVEESDDEEEIELEFERAVDKVHTHTPYCPNCSSRITKVILRRKKKASPRPDKPLDLLGCLRCFSIFIPSGAGHRLNPFNCFGSNSKPNLQSPNTEHEQPTTDVDGTNAPGLSGEAKPDATVDIDGPGITGVGSILQQPLISGHRRSKSLEILKCIVYGGLIESIASLSIVSSAAASDATTLNVVVIGLATLLSGLMAFGCNLVELRNDGSDEKYQEVLGQKGHFLFHSMFAILSYLIFGLVAPTTYGLAFRESDDKDYKILAVAAAGFGCIFILAIAKAYVKGTNKFGGYVKTILYYVTLAVSASGVAYAAGDLFGMLLDDLGWFQPAQDVVPRVSAWASY